MNKVYLWAVIAVSLFQSIVTKAQGVDSSRIIIPQMTIDEVVIQENRIDFTSKNIPKNMSVISRKEIKGFAVQSVSELFSYQSAIDLRQRGPLGVQADLRINGGTFEQSLILINGVKLTDPQSGHHLMNLPLELENIDRIEIIKGASTKRYGQNAFGGAVNLITKVPDSNFIYLKTYFGDFTTKGGSAALSFNKNKQHHYLSFGGDFSQGYRYNTDFEMTNVFYQGQFNVRKEKSIDLIFGLSDRSFGANGFYSTPTAKEQYEEIMTAFGIASYNFKKKNWEVMPRLSWRFNNDKYDFIRQNPERYHNDHSTQSMSVELHLTNDNKWGQSGVGVEHRMEMIEGKHIRSAVYSPSNLDGFERTNTSFYLEHKFNLFKKRFLLSPGLYASRFSHFKANFFPAMEGSYWLLEGVNVFASVSKSYRVPTFYDQYYESPVEQGNPDLRPEQAWSYEAGIRFNRNAFMANISLLQRNNSNLIDWVWSQSEEKWFAQNYNHFTNRLLDLNVEYIKTIPIWKERLNIESLKLSYFTMNQDEGEEDLMNSRYVLDLLNNQLIGILSMTVLKKITLSFAYRYIDRMQVSSYHLVDAKVIYRILNYEFFMEASNITNTAYVEIMTPMPGRWFRAGVNLNLKY